MHRHTLDWMVNEKKSVAQLCLNPLKLSLVQQKIAVHCSKRMQYILMAQCWASGQPSTSVAADQVDHLSNDAFDDPACCWKTLA